MLRTWARDGYLQVPKLKLFEVMARTKSFVTIHPKKIIKIVKIESDTEREFFDNFYGEIFPKLKGKYELISYRSSISTMYLQLGPVGYTTLPTTENELKAAILDVLNTVNILHENNIVHRDICWRNIIRLMDNSWMLIDFEEAALIEDRRYKSNRLIRLTYLACINEFFVIIVIKT